MTEVESVARAEAVIVKVKACLPPIWLGGLQRIALTTEISRAILQAYTDGEHAIQRSS